MTIDELAKKLCDETNGEVSQKQAVALIKALPNVIRTSVKNDGEIELNGIGRFVKQETPARTGRNPRTGEQIEIAAKTTISVKLFPKFKKI